MSYRQKVMFGIAIFVLFWLFIFYPKILPWMNEIHMYPLFATIIYESLFFYTLYLISSFLLGQATPHYKFKVSYAMFALYHVFDAFEPPFVLMPTGLSTLNESSIISWDYGVGYAIQQFTGYSWITTYYITNVLVIAFLLISAIYVVRPQLLKKLLVKIFD